MGSIPRPTYRSSYRGSPIIRSLGSTNFCPGTSVYRTPLPPPKLLNHSVRNLHLRTPLRRLSLSPTRVNSVPTGRLRRIRYSVYSITFVERNPFSTAHVGSGSKTAPLTDQCSRLKNL